jgi:hypothetical protein
MTDNTFVKDPEDVLDYDLDYANPVDRWLSEGDTLNSATATLDVDDTSNLVIDSVGFTDTMVKLWLSGGDDGETALIHVLVTTVGLRTKEVDVRIRIREGGC